MRISHEVFAAAGLSVLLATAAYSQGTKSSFDRTVVPTAGANPTVKVPHWTKSTLSNGAQLVVVERHSLPLVSFQMSFIGGSNQFDPADKPGVGSVTATMMAEGTTTRSAEEVSNALQLLGTSFGFGIGGEGGSVSFRSVKDKLEPTLAIMVDEILHPAFPDAALDRVKQRLLVNLRQSRDQTPSIAATVYPKLLYTTDHPYGRSTSEASVASMTRQDIMAFHDAFFQPSHAVITVVGDITPAEAKAKIEKAFAPWAGTAGPVAFNYPATPAPKATTIYLVDKPGAAQSTFTIGVVGPPRSTPDYYALRVTNAILGGELGVGTRLNANIREAKGWSYGVGSGFAYGRGPGQFRVGGDVQTDKTDSSLVEFVREIKNIRGDKPVSDDELKAAKAALVQSLPSRPGTMGGVNSMVSEIFINGLPEDYWTQFQRGVNAVTAADVQRVAQKYIDADHLTILIVGDRAKIEAAVKATGIAPVVVLDKNGNPL
jgi:zinc protease